MFTLTQSYAVSVLGGFTKGVVALQERVMLFSIAGGAWRVRMASQSILLKEVVIEPNVKLECVPKFYYLGDSLGAGGGMEENKNINQSIKQEPE